VHLNGAVKMGYYPTPLRVVELIRKQFFMPDRTIHALDPCCGEGLALESLLRGLPAIGHGIELDGARAAEAEKRLRHVVHAGYEQVDIAFQSMSLLFLNPPYDDGETERKELTFLRDLLPALAPGGVLVYIIPRRRLRLDIAELLLAHFQNVKVHRFPDEDYAAFGQIVVLGKRLPYPTRGNAAGLVQEVEDPDLPVLPASVFDKYVLPETGNAEIKLRRQSPAELVAMARTSPLWARVKDLVEPPTLGALGRPPAPLHVGHLGLLLSAGCLNGQVGEGDDRHIVVGKPVKHVVESTDVEEGEDGDLEVTHRLETFRVTIKMLLPTGELRKLA
jgi:hypothetical protein